MGIKVKEIESWLNADELAKIYTSDCWNDIEEEKKKSWWIVGKNFEKCKNYLNESGLLSEFEEALKLSGILNNPNRKLQIADLAAGICWTSALISQIPNVETIHAVDISRHRMELLSPLVFEMLNGNPDKLHRYIGSFYNIKLTPNSIDYIFLSQAFHHAEFPLKLLFECDKVIRPGGTLILIGEHYIDSKSILKKIIKYSIKNKRFTIDFDELYPADKLSGDHYYSFFHYKFLMNKMGYSFEYKFLQKLNRVIYSGVKNVA